MRVVGGEDPAAVRPAVRIHQDRKRTVRLLVPGGEHHGARNPPCAPFGELRTGGQHRLLRVTRDDGGLLAVPEHPNRRSGHVQSRGDHDGHTAGPDRRVHARALRDPLHAQLVDPVHMGLADLRRGRPLARRRRDQDVRLPDVQHRPDLQLGPGQRPVTHRENPGPALVRDPHQPPVRRPRGHTREQLQPHRVLVRVHRPGRPGLRIHRQIELTLLVTGLHQQQRRPVRRPVHPRQIREPDPVPHHFGTFPGQPHHEEPHLGIGCTGRRVRDPGGLAVRVRGIGDPPAPHRAVVHPGHQQPVRVRRPPETARTRHLLGRDELREAVGDVLVLRLRERPVLLAAGAHDAQRTLGHICDVSPVGGGSRVDHRSRHGQRTRRSGPQLGDVHLPRERERRQLGGCVDRVADDPRRPLAAPLTPGPLLDREPLRRTGQQYRRIGHDPLPRGLAVAEVQHPELPRAVGARPRAEEDHPFTIG